ncbi:winged helix-turn-helix transcriptional regulator [Sphaerisporangium dianthi]|uniref:Winged helix-turn-helix transcriptional regulator n=1 Tax=Sphaerisporangium dianthi TaxID=1436120 RepID=A0ABV9CIE7_9ACTN
MDGERVDQAACGHLFEVFALLGKRWNGLILGTLLDGPARFSELERIIPGIRGPMLSRRLAELAEVGLVERHVETGPPVEVYYRLTIAGEGLRRSVHELSRWGETFLGPSARSH